MVLHEQVSKVCKTFFSERDLLKKMYSAVDTDFAVRLSILWLIESGHIALLTKTFLRTSKISCPLT
jgi:hypothetical protein